MARWAIIEGFPNYAVSDAGQVKNIAKDTLMTPSPTLHDELTVGLMVDGYQYRRTIKGLVARAFVPGEDEIFNTPILLDGDRTNLDSRNILWRPRWFAIMYMQQWDEESTWWHAGPVLDSLGYQYESILEAGIRTGSLISQIRQGLLNSTPVFPTGRIFGFI